MFKIVFFSWIILNFISAVSAGNQPSAGGVMDCQIKMTLHEAILKDRPDVLDYIIKTRGRNLLNKMDGMGRTALFIAAKEGKRASVDFLIKMGADVHVKDRVGYTALKWVVHLRQAEIAQMLIRGNADVECPDRSDKTLLMYTVGYHWHRLTEILIEGGANVNAVDKAGNTALHTAVKTANVEAIELLLAYGSDPYAGNAKGVKPIDGVFRQHSCSKASVAFAFCVGRFQPQYANQALIKFNPALSKFAENYDFNEGDFESFLEEGMKYHAKNSRPSARQFQNDVYALYVVLASFYGGENRGNFQVETFERSLRSDSLNFENAIVRTIFLQDHPLLNTLPIDLWWRILSAGRYSVLLARIKRLAFVFAVVKRLIGDEGVGKEFFEMVRKPKDLGNFIKFVSL